MGQNATHLATEPGVEPLDPALLDFALCDSGMALYRAVLDEEPRLTWLSPAAPEITGLETGALTAPGGWLGHVHPEDREGWSDPLAGLDAARPCCREYRLCTPAGVRWIRDRARLASAPGERPVRLVGSLLDVTAEHAGAVLEDALMAVNDALGVVGPDGRVSHCSQAYADLLGLDVAGVRTLGEKERFERLAGKIRSFDGVRVDGGDALAARMEALVDGPGHRQAEVELASGEWRLLTVHRRRDGGRVSVATDITRLKRAERIRQEVVRLLHDAVESIPNDFAIIDPDGRLALCNSAFARAYASDPDMLHGSTRAFRVPVFLRQVSTIDGQPLTRSDLEAANWADRLENEHTAEVELKSGEWKLVTGSRLSNGGIAVMRTDITHLKRTEQTLRASEARYRALVQHAPVAICEFGRDGRLRALNAKALEVGFVEDECEVLGRPMTDLVSEADHDRVQALFDAAVAGEAVAFEHLRGGKGGEPVNLVSNLVPIKGEDGRVDTVVSISNDITAIRRRERDLLQARETLEDAVESLSEGVALFDEKGALVLCNERYRDFNPACRDLLSPRASWKSLVRAGSERAQFLEPDTAVRLGGVLPPRERIEYLQCDGRWLMHSARKTRQGGVVVGLTDITERKQAEEALRESEALVRQVLEACPVPVRMSRLADGKILYQNPASVAVAGERDPAQARWAQSYYADPADREPYVETLRRDQRVDDYPLLLTRGEHDTFQGSVSARLIQYKGDDVVVATFEDITERLALEAQMARQREALYQSEKLSALGELLASVAHELNNPLSVVVGQALLLEETADDPAIASRAVRIGKAADRCTRIVRTFLAMARQTPGEHRSVDLNDVVRTALEITAYGLRTADVEVREDLDPQLPPIIGHRDQLTQVITNLVLNAQHALESVPGPRRLRVITARRGNVVQVRVVDNGPGVPESIRGRIFEPLFTTKEVGAGTGIGLALCHRIVASHGGSFHLERNDRPGATFTIRLPVDRAGPGEVVSEDAARPSAATLSVLVVDDETEVADTLADILREDGHRVDMVHSGTQALECLARHAYDLVMSDLRMPGLDGPGLHTALSGSMPEYLDRLVFITGDTMEGPMRQFLEDAARPYLEKPIRPSEVRALVASAGGRRAGGGRG